LDQKGIEEVFDQLNVTQRDEFKEGGYTAADLYLNDKIPFAFNYVDNDLEVTHATDSQGDHGTHVSGISTANRFIKDADGSFTNALSATRVTGDAPDAQLYVMKVFGKNGGAWDSDFIVAIEDAIILGADSCNLSLGSAEEGFATEIAYPYQDILDSLVESDTVVAIAAGNEYYYSYRDSNRRMLYAEDVSNDHVGSPSSYDNALAVASCSNAGSASYLLTVKDRSFTYTEPSAGQEKFVSLGGEQEYVLIDGFGSEEDFAALKGIIEGRIVFVQRGGDINFAAKANGAAAAGALATVIYNNAGGTLNMSLNGYQYTNPVIGMTQADAAAIKGLSDEKTTADGAVYYEGTITVGTEMEVIMPDLQNGVSMSAFSSFGVPASLTLKPEITAPGGNIYSTRGNNDSYYGNMSGTSMATPQVAGLSAVAAQYIKENKLDEQEGITVRALAQSLLMSTAYPVFESGTNYYSVMKQGAGLANVGRVVTAKGYILMDEEATTGAADGKVKAEFYDDPDRTGEYSYKFTFNNLTDETLEYTLDTDMFTQAVQTYEGSNRPYQDGTFLSTATSNITADVTYTVNGEPFELNTEVTADVDQDGDTDVDDARAILMIVDGNRTIADYGYEDDAAVEPEEGEEPAPVKTAEEKYLANADVDGDGDADTYDAHLILASAEYEGFTVEPHGSAEIEVSIVLSDETKAAFDEKTPNGAYVEGYTYVLPMTSEEGEILDVEYSIPLFGFYGNWSDSSMYDKSNYSEYVAAGSDYYALKQLPYTISWLQRNRVPYFANTLLINDGEWYNIFPGNVKQDEVAYEKASINSQTVINGIYGRLIRNAGVSAAIVTNADDEIVFLGDVDPQTWRVFYYTLEYQGRNQSGWWEEDDIDWEIYPYGHNGNDINKSAAELGFAEGDTFTVKALNIPEYYTRHEEKLDEEFIRDIIASGKLGKGVWLEQTLLVDDTLPELLSVKVVNTRDAETGEEKSELVVSASDNAYLGMAVLTTPNNVLYEAFDSEKGGSGEVKFDITGVGESDYMTLLVNDYATNYRAYSFTLDGTLTPFADGEVTVLDVLNPASSIMPEGEVTEAQGSLDAMSEETVRDEETSTVTVTLTAQGDTNGLYTVAYDPEVLTFSSLETLESYSDYVLADGLITVDFASKEAVEDVFANIIFTYEATDVDRTTDVVITTLQENEEHPETTITETVELPGNRYNVTVTAGENGTVEPEGTFEAMVGDEITVEAVPDLNYV
ncbi:MAG: S8 family serine peptidase, partial [Solobacterium sp.]|nr:S8 family serine peptidase [Solobacterium sp.]